MYSYDRRLASDAEDLEELKSTIQVFLRRDAPYVPTGYSFKQLSSRSTLSPARMKALVKKYPKEIAALFGGKGIELESAGSSGGQTGYKKPFETTNRPQRYKPSGFRVTK